MTNSAKGPWSVLTTSCGELVALGRPLVSSKEAGPLKCGLIISPSTVFMEPGTYPRGWKKLAVPALHEIPLKKIPDNSKGAFLC